jgi:hypothetical protein
MFVLGIASIIFFGASLPTQSAVNPPVFHLGPLNVEQGQTAFVSVTNPTDKAGRAKVQIYDQQGDLLKQRRPLIEPGHTAFVSRLMEEEGIFYYWAQLTLPNGSQAWPMALQVFDGNEPLGVVSKQSRRSTGEVTSPMVRLGPDQDIRVLVTNLRSSSAQFSVYLRNPAGQQLGFNTLSNASKATKTTTFDNVSGTYVRAAVKGPQNTKFLAMVEIFDASTGQTLSYLGLEHTFENG